MTMEMMEHAEIETNGASSSTAESLVVAPAVETMQRTVHAHPMEFFDALPIALFVIDGASRVVFANDRWLSMVGRTRDDVIGMSALDLIDSRDLKQANGFLTSVPSFGDRVLGPRFMRYLGADDVSHNSQFWARETPPEFGVAGYIITVMPESVRDVLAGAVSVVATDTPIDRALTAIIAAARAMPLDGIGTLLVVEPSAPTDEERFSVVGSWPIAPELVNAFGTPWRRCMVMNEAQEVNELDVDARTGAEMAMAKLSAAWIRPVRNACGEVAAILIVWRASVSEQTPNQDEHLGDVVRLAELAFERDGSRRSREYAAHRDALTGVGNRPSLNDRIELEQQPANVLFIDLDHFRAVNDTFGHAVGDEVIAQVGRRISDLVRSSDDVYRAGGDQFIVVCDPESNDGSGPVRLAERLIERLTSPFDCAEHRVRIGATIGVASGRPRPGATRSLADTIHAANRAMGLAKERGRGCTHHADFLD